MGFMDYKTAGVDVEAGRSFVDKIRSSVEATHTSEVIGGLGGFGGMLRLPKGFQQPVLVAGTDGVGTKLELAQENNSHYGVGIDLVAMCVNDVITSGAKPLFFLDYIASGKLNPESMADVVQGIAKGCLLSECALLGGETAEMPGFYARNQYDLAGFCVAIVEENDLINGNKILPGDKVIAVASSGLHSNGFSLVRKILSLNKDYKKTVIGKDQIPLIDALLAPTTIYSDLVKGLLNEQIPINGMAHITGGGIPENLPRCLPKGVRASLDITSWEKPELFQWLQKEGQIPEKDLWNTFNLGVGFCLVVNNDKVKDTLDFCKQNDHTAWMMGSIGPKEEGEKSIFLSGYS